MTICPSCGQQSPVAARFCLACGTRLAEEEATRREVRKIVTVVFSDVASSTELGERLDPESLRRAMGRYFDEMREARVAGDKPLRVSLVPARKGLSPLVVLIGNARKTGTPASDRSRRLRGQAGIGSEVRETRTESTAARSSQSHSTMAR